jgi:hypothetical protein
MSAARAQGGSMVAQPPDPTRSEDKIAIAEFAVLSQFAAANGLHATLMMDDGGGCIAYPDQTIVLDRSQITTNLSKIDSNRMSAFVRFLLAHELSHLIQFNKYSYAPATASDPVRQEMESEADIGGGMILYLTLTSQLQSNQTTQIIQDALQLVFNMGQDAEFIGGFHPTHEGRRTSLRYGLSLGTYEYALEAINAGASMYVSSRDHLSAVLELQQTHSVPWTRYMARQITHTGFPNMTSVINSDVDPGISANGMKFNYQVTYTNITPKSVAFDGSVQSISFLRSSPNDTFQSLLWGSNTQRIQLAPGGSVTVTGAMDRVDNSQYVAKLVCPPDPIALYSTGS